MKNYTIRLFALMLTFGVFITSCDIDLTAPEIDSETTEDNALSERAVSDIFGMVNTGISTDKSGVSCGDYDFNFMTNTLTITFPAEGCEGADGVTRSGEIHAQFAGTWQMASSSVEITFVNYKRDGKTISGTINVQYASGGDQPAFLMTATNMSLTFTDGKSTTWESSNTYTWIEGVTTLFDHSDDVYSVTGTTTGTARNGNEFSRVATDLVSSPTCKWFTSGNIILTITNDDKTSVYNMTFKEPCGTVTILHKGISVTRTF